MARELPEGHLVAFLKVQLGPFLPTLVVNDITDDAIAVICPAHRNRQRETSFLPHSKHRSRIRIERRITGNNHVQRVDWGP